jgi:hypothetical protein
MRNRRFCPSLDMLSSRIVPSGIAPSNLSYSPNLTFDLPVVDPYPSPPTTPSPEPVLLNYTLDDLFASLIPFTTAQPTLAVNPMN